MEGHRAAAGSRGSPYPVAEEARAGVVGVDVPDEGEVHVLHKDQEQQPLHANRGELGDRKQGMVMSRSSLALLHWSF